MGWFEGLGGCPVEVCTDSVDLFVTPNDSGDCSQATPCDLHTALSAAVDGVTIYLAQGTYTGTGEAVVTSTQSLTLLGGWDDSPTSPPTRNPDAYPTTIDGQEAWRGIFISKGITATLDGLSITGRNTTGLGGGQWENDVGGEVYIYEATAIINNCTIYKNIDSTGSNGSGGSLFLRGSDAALSGNMVVSNMANSASHSHGGGLFLYGGNATLNSYAVQGNTASSAGWGYGSGIDLLTSNATLSSSGVV